MATSSPTGDADTLRAVERSRLRVLVARDLDAALPLQASDFQLITPRGRASSRGGYFDAIGTAHATRIA